MDDLYKRNQYIIARFLRVGFHSDNPAFQRIYPHLCQDDILGFLFRNDLNDLGADSPISSCPDKMDVYPLLIRVMYSICIPFFGRRASPSASKVNTSGFFKTDLDQAFLDLDKVNVHLDYGINLELFKLVKVFPQ